MPMSSTESAVLTARLVIIATSSVLSSAVAVVLYRRIPEPNYDTRRRDTKPLPPPYTTGSALVYSIVMTDWLFSTTGAISLSMDIVMGPHVKTRTVIGVAFEALFHMSFLMSLLWGIVLAIFVLQIHLWTRDYPTMSLPMKKFPVRSSWMTISTIGLGGGLLSSARLQSLAAHDRSAFAISTCQRYLYFCAQLFSVSCVITANFILFIQRRSRSALPAMETTATANLSLRDSSNNEIQESTKNLEIQAQHALLKAHEKLMRYCLLVQALQLPMMLSYKPGRGETYLNLSDYEYANCLLFCIPLLNAIAYGWKYLGEVRYEEDLRINQTMIQSSYNGSRFIDRYRDRMGTGLVVGNALPVGNNGLASSFRSVFGASILSSSNGKESFKSTYVGNEIVTLDELNGLSNVSFLAEGATGSVYKAQWLGIEVAMKLIKLPNGGGCGMTDAELYRTIIQNSEEAFIEEARLCSRLRHPNITLFMRAGYYQGKLGILTEYCSRGSLKDVLKQYFPLCWRRKVTIALHISKGLTYLHARNPTYIHRDLKASNILVTETWHAKLADFGISKVANFVNRVRFSDRAASLAEQNGSLSDDLTSFAGTWRWNAPEILQDPHNCRYSRATDMYSFGMVLWELASDGAVPFSESKFDFEVREKVLLEERPSIQLGPRGPQRFAQLIEECWAQNPVDRPSAPQAAEILNTILDNIMKDPIDSMTLSSASGSEYTNSLYSSLRNGDAASDVDNRRSSYLGQRITNYFRSRFSLHSSNSSTTSEEYHDHQEFYRFTSPYGRPDSITMKSTEYNADLSGLPIINLPRDSRLGDALVGGRLPSLGEYEFKDKPSEFAMLYNPSGSDLAPYYQVQPAIAREVCNLKEETRLSEDEAEFVLGATSPSVLMNI